MPSLTFHQYAQAPLYFQNVEVKTLPFSRSSHEVESQLKDALSSYFNVRFQSHDKGVGTLKIEPLSVTVEKTYLKDEKKSALLSPWTSYDQYMFKADIKLDLTCQDEGKGQVFTVVKGIKIPNHYSLYKRDIQIISIMESYISKLDTAILKAGFVCVQ